MQSQLTLQDEWIDAYDIRIQRLSRQDEQGVRLMEMRGFDPPERHRLHRRTRRSTSFSFRASLFGQHWAHAPRALQRRQAAAVRHLQTGGDCYLRTMLIHGARSALRCAEGKDDRLLQWALKLKEAKGFNVAAVALANKLARVAWA